MKVYLLMCGCYEDRYVAGAYSTPELAMAASRVPENDSKRLRPGGWEKTQYGWSNGFDWNDAADVEEFEVDRQTLDNGSQTIDTEPQQ